MFGYVKPYVPDLRVREHEMYRALYCGLCHSMGRHTGCISRFTLSYDFVFLAAVRTALEGCGCGVCARRCMAHPLRKRPCVCESEALSYSAACAALLTMEKNQDDINDKNGIKKLPSMLLRPAARHMYKKAARGHSLPAEDVRQNLQRLSSLENSGCPSLDDTADCFGNLLAAVFSYGLPDGAARIAAVIGKSTGRCIYVMDAADDAEDDRKSGSYNPLLISPQSSGSLSTAVRLELEKMASAVELIDFSGQTEISEIIRNTVYEGIPREADRIFNGRKKTKHRKDKTE